MLRLDRIAQRDREMSVMAADETPGGALYDRLQAAAAVIAERSGRDHHDEVVVLGSGWSDYASGLEGSIAIPFADIPGFPEPKAMGHRGTAHSFESGGRNILVYAGRVHAYEGYSMDEVTFAVRTAIIAGCRTVMLTNAAGGIAAEVHPGEIVLLADHINGAGVSPLSGPNDERLGPRFPDMTKVYTPALRARAKAAAAEVGITAHEGVYYWWHGPMFETPAEIRMIQVLGATVVGMSTVPEATAARHMGADVLGVSLCTNKAAGVTGESLSAEEVMEVAAATQPQLTALFDKLLGIERSTS